MSTFPHCRHCSWTHPAHVEIHHNACGCDQCPYPPQRRTLDAYGADDPLFEVSEERAAALTVAERADGTEDARLVMQMLGLIPSPEPRRKRMPCPGGCQHDGGAPIGYCFRELDQAPARPYATGPQDTREGGMATGHAILHWLLANGYAEAAA